LRSNAQISARSIDILRGDRSDPAKIERALNALAKIVASTDQATARLEQTVGALRSFARLDEAEVQAEQVTKPIEDAIALLPTELDRIELVKNYAADLVPLTCRPGELNQVFMHVLRNAAQAGAKRIAIDATRALEGVTVTITDNGRGMSKDTLARIFDPTFSSTGERVKMGFGLAASQGIVEDHAGRIEIDSTPGAGTKVKITLAGAAAE
jgi:two-component system, NtrC family, sensor kinase